MSYGLKYMACREAEPTAAAAGQAAHGVCTIDPGRSSHAETDGGRAQGRPLPGGERYYSSCAGGDLEPADYAKCFLHKMTTPATLTEPD